MSRKGSATEKKRIIEVILFYYFAFQALEQCFFLDFVLKGLKYQQYPLHLQLIGIVFPEYILIFYLMLVLLSQWEMKKKLRNPIIFRCKKN